MLSGAVVVHLIVALAVGAYLVTAFTTSNLLAARLVHLDAALLCPHFRHLSGKDGERGRLVLMLAAVGLDTYLQPGRPMDRNYGRFRLVPMLPSRPIPFRGRYLHVIKVQPFRGFRDVQDGHSYGRSLDAPSLFSGRDALPTMATALVTEVPDIGPCEFQRKEPWASL